MIVGKNIVLESFKFGFRSLYEHILLFVLVMLTTIGIVALGGIISVLFFLQCNWVLSVLHIGVIIPFFLVLALMVMMFFAGLWLGLNKIALDLYDYDKSSVKKLFSCFKLAPRALVAGVIYSIAVGVGSMLFVIPGIFLAIRFSLFSFFIIDQKVGPIESLKMSYKITKKHGWQLFFVRALMYAMMVIPVWCGYLLVFSGIMIPSLLVTSLYGISLLAAAPLSALVYAYFYRSLIYHERALEQG